MQCYLPDLMRKEREAWLQRGGEKLRGDIVSVPVGQGNSLPETIQQERLRVCSGSPG